MIGDFSATEVHKAVELFNTRIHKVMELILTQEEMVRVQMRYTKLLERMYTILNPPFL